MQKISIYMNPKASSASKSHWRQEIENSLFRSELNFKNPQNIEELNINLEEDIKNEVSAIISIGGDGTVNTLIQKIANENIGLLVIPAGTANDLACELGNNGKLRNVINCIRNKEHRSIDLIEINGRLMATNGGIGLGGSVASQINDLRKKYPMFKNLMKHSGKGIYGLFAAGHLFSQRLEQYKFKIECDEFTGIVEPTSLLVNNQPTLAGTFNIAPNTSNQDGKFNVSLFNHTSRSKLASCLLKISEGKTVASDPELISFETSNLKITNLSKETKTPMFFGDGEIFGENEEWNIGIRPSSLKVFAMDAEKSLVNMSTEVSLS